VQYPEQLGRQRANGKDDTRDIAANSDRVGSNDEYDRRRRGCGFACLRRFADELARQLDVAKELLPELANQHRLPFVFGTAIDFHIRDDSRCGSARKGRRRLSHVPVAVLALTPMDLTVHSFKASALFNLIAPPLHMAGLGVVLP
jgi:hypothetical protein